MAGTGEVLETRRVANYPFLPGNVTTLNQISTVGSFILGASTLFFLYNVYKTWKSGDQVSADDPWASRTRWSGRRRARRPGTISRRSRVSDPSGPHSTFTTLALVPAGGARPAGNAALKAHGFNWAGRWHRGRAPGAAGGP